MSGPMNAAFWDVSSLDIAPCWAKREREQEGLVRHPLSHPPAMIVASSGWPRGSRHVRMPGSCLRARFTVGKRQRGLHHNYRHPAVAAAAVRFPRLPEDGLSSPDLTPHAVCSADPSCAVRDAEELPPASWVSTQRASWCNSRDVCSKVCVGGESSDLDEMQTGASVLIDIALIEFNPPHGDTLSRAPFWSGRLPFDAHQHDHDGTALSTDSGRHAVAAAHAVCGSGWPQHTLAFPSHGCPASPMARAEPRPDARRGEWPVWCTHCRDTP